MVRNVHDSRGREMADSCSRETDEYTANASGAIVVVATDDGSVLVSCSSGPASAVRRMGVAWRSYTNSVIRIRIFSVFLINQTIAENQSRDTIFDLNSVFFVDETFI